MVGAEQLFAHRGRWAEMPFGIGIAILAVERVAKQAMEICRHEMLGAILLKREIERLASDRLRVGGPIVFERVFDLTGEEGDVVGHRGKGWRYRRDGERAGQKHRK